MKNPAARLARLFVLGSVCLCVPWPGVAQDESVRKPPPLPPSSPRSTVLPAQARPQLNSNAAASPTPVARVQPPPAPPAPLLSPTAPPAPSPPPLAALPIAALTPGETPPNPNAIKWDAEVKEYKASSGDAAAHFTFWLTNVSSAEVLVNGVRTSCGCTVAQLPSQPWHIAAGADGPINVTVNLAGKAGLITKGVTVETSAGTKQLTVKVDIPPGAGITPGPVPALTSGTMADSDRMKNMQLSLADRQVVFKNQECAKCHADPAKGRTDGRLVYTAVCATCHNSHLRASMVPDLRTLKHPTDAEYWRKWVSYGRPGSMMPAFAASEGGPLTEQQLNALVDFLVKAFSNRPSSAQAKPAPALRPAPLQSASSAPLLKTP